MVEQIHRFCIGGMGMTSSLCYDGPMTSVSMILPTYNERENLQRLIPAIEEAFHGTPLEILVIDDGSPDGTASAAEALHAQFGNSRVLQRPGRLGLGSALRRGYEEARHDALVSCDTDGSFAAHDLVRLVTAIEQGCDLVLGSRHAPGSRYETPHWRIRVKYWISALGNRPLRTLTKLPCHDFSVNCRAIRREIWQALQTRESSNAFLLEMILAVSAQGGRLAEIPVTFLDRRLGRSKLNLWSEVPRFCLVIWRHVVRRRPRSKVPEKLLQSLS